MRNRVTTPKSPEWGTFALILGCYGLWAVALFWVALVSPLAATLLAAVLVAFHSSLTHEVLHGHPFASKPLNEALVFLPLSLAVPYNRFRDLHLAHHLDSNLTDPYDDPESNYMDPAVWSQTSRWKKALFRINNTLFGRILLGPAIGQVLFCQDEWRAAVRGDRAVLIGWGLHALGVCGVLALVWASPMTLWSYLIATYFALGILRIRTFLEHQAHEKVRGRTVIIEDRGPLSWMFLNNNLHMVHHMNPGAAWYDLPALYRRGKDRYLACNQSYVYRSYGEVFQRYLFKAKDSVPHPLWPQD